VETREFSGSISVFPHPAREKTVTIAAGFMAEDGMEICADSQHTGSTAKFDQKKIREVVPMQNTLLVFCGAGDSDYINSVGDLIDDGFAKCKKTPDAIRELIKQSVLRIYRDQISPFWRIRDQDAPQIFAFVSCPSIRTTSDRSLSISPRKISIHARFSKSLSLIFGPLNSDGKSSW
jgi:hypothetical protein